MLNARRDRVSGRCHRARRRGVRGRDRDAARCTATSARRSVHESPPRYGGGAMLARNDAGVQHSSARRRVGAAERRARPRRHSEHAPRPRRGSPTLGGGRAWRVAADFARESCRSRVDSRTRRAEAVARLTAQPGERTSTRLDGQRSLSDAALAARRARVADAPAVPDQQVREAVPVRARDEPHQVALDLHRILLPRQPEPLREPPHVRVDDDPLRVAELGGDDVRRLARDAGQAHELARAAAAPARRTRRAASASCRAATSPSAGRSRSRRCRARAPPAAPPGSPRAAGTCANSRSVTRLTFTSVVCAESITETSSSSGDRSGARSSRRGARRRAAR